MLLKSATTSTRFRDANCFLRQAGKGGLYFSSTTPSHGKAENSRQDKQSKAVRLSQLLALTQSKLTTVVVSNSENKAEEKTPVRLLPRREDVPSPLLARKKKIDLAQRAFYHHPSTSGSNTISRNGPPLLPPPPINSRGPSNIHGDVYSEQSLQQRAKVPTPREIRSFLDKYVIGQDEMKRRLAIALYNHYIRLENNESSDSDLSFGQMRGGKGGLIPPSPPFDPFMASPKPGTKLGGPPRFPQPFSLPKKPMPTLNVQSPPSSLDLLLDHGVPSLPPPSSTPKRHNDPVLPKLTGTSNPNVSITLANSYPQLTPASAKAAESSMEPNYDEPVVVEKSNVLLVGPSGSGKTMVIKTIAKLLDVPFSMNDATPLTQAGYIGEDVEICIYRLLQSADFDVSRAERGIVFLDEVDKIASRTSSVSNSSVRDASGEGVQQGLLRMLEGTTINFNVKVGNLPPHLRPQGASPAATEPFSVDTSNILFVCAGAFVGLDKIVKERHSVRGSIGFGATLGAPKGDEKAEETPAHANESADLNWLPNIEPDDLIRFGLIPEFIGRLPIVVTAKPLTAPELCLILVEPKNSLIQQFQRLFERFNVKLSFTSSSIQAIAQQALKKKTGARGLRRILENVLVDVQYDLPGSEYKYALVTKDAIEGKASVMVFKANEYGTFLHNKRLGDLSLDQVSDSDGLQSQKTLKI